MRKLKMDEVRELGMRLCMEALRAHPPVPDDWRRECVAGVIIEGDERIFEIYLPQERPQDAIVLTSVVINVRTGEAAAVEVFPEKWSG